jgi:hypothetical protein
VEGNQKGLPSEVAKRMTFEEQLIRETWVKETATHQPRDEIPVGTCSQLQGDPTRVNSDVNRVLAQDGNSSVNLASHGHCVGVFIGI